MSESTVQFGSPSPIDGLVRRQPILGLVEKSLNTAAANAVPEDATAKFTNEPMTDRHHSVLLAAIADELACEVEDIHDFEL